MNFPNELFSFRSVALIFTTHPPWGVSAERAIGGHTGQMIGQTLRTVGLGKMMNPNTRSIANDSATRRSLRCAAKLLREPAQERREFFS